MRRRLHCRTALLGDLGDTALIASIKPFVQGFTILYWATATWWIPMLLVLGIWRHFVRRIPLTYDPLYWGAVFPLGMYSVSTHELAQAMQFDFLSWIPRVFFWIALAAWTTTFAGLVRQLMRRRHNLKPALALTALASFWEGYLSEQSVEA